MPMNNWLNAMDRLLGGDGTAFRQGKKDTSEAANPVIQQPATDQAPIPTKVSPLHVGARNLVDHLAPAAMKIESDRIYLVGEGWVRVWFVEDLPPII